MEFSAEEGVAYLPHWVSRCIAEYVIDYRVQMMQQLQLEPGALINVFNVTLPKGAFVKLQPHLTKFTTLSNPRVVYDHRCAALHFALFSDVLCFNFHVIFQGWRRRCARFLA